MTISANSLIVASVQMTSSASWAENLANAEKHIRNASEAGAKVIALPEYFCLMGHADNDKVKIREKFDNGPMQNSLKELSQKYGIYLIGGTLPLESEQANKVKNSTLVFDPNGNIVVRYDKIHLFGFKQGKEEYQESNSIEPGTQACRFEISENNLVWTFGLSICYDLRFPELYRAIGPVDCHIIPAAFTYTTGKAHWEILLRARAIENQCYVLASAQSGKHENGRATWGQSMLIDPWGEISSELKNGPGFILGKLEKNILQEIRTKLPSLQHRTLN
jgi:nitrilase